MKSLGQTIASRDNNFDTVRLILAVSVIFAHSSLAGEMPITNSVDHLLKAYGTSSGNLAVCCFFFLSGLFVTQSFHRSEIALHFIVRRVCRIWPGLFVCLVVTAALSCFLSQGVRSIFYLFSSDFYRYIVDNGIFTLTWTIPGVFEGRPVATINGSIHTIPSEVKLYGLLLFLISLLPMKSTRNIAIGGAGFLLLTLLLFDPIHRFLAMPAASLPYFLMFFSGVIAYAAADRIKPYWWLGAGGLALLLMLPAPANKVAFFFTACWAMIFVGQLRGWRPRKDLSYGIYIYGWPCQQFIGTLFPTLGPYSNTAASLLLVLVFAIASWHLIEYPAIQFGHRLTTSAELWRNRFIPSQAVLMAGLAATFCLCFILKSVARDFDPRIVDKLDLTIVDFGPQPVAPGADFNVQRNGSSALWLALDRDPPANARIVLAGQVLETARGPHLITAFVPQRLYREAGAEELFVEVWTTDRIQRSASVTFQISE